MTHEEFIRRLEAVELLFWLLKDAGWVLLFPALSMPAAFVAMCLEACLLLLQWKVEPTDLLVHRMVVFVWLTGNTTWMTSELLFMPSREPGRQLPWHHVPVLDASEERYNLGLHMAQGIFVLALGTLLGFYARSALRRMSSSPGEPAEKTRSPRSESVLGLFTPEVYSVIFIGPWLTKDLCWSFNLFMCAMPFDLAVIMLKIDYIQRFRSYTSVTGFWWVIANTIWICGELLLNDLHRWPRITAGLILSADCMLAIMAFSPSNKHLMFSPRRPVYGSSDDR